ncbi:MAG TPA: thiamine pyrophosphate-binding protein [Burkholderiales bacterium]|nr:thiamine pyrophosphate-binding protein [Burkholderiales bacterium]
MAQRGADAVARALAQGGVRRLFSLSGNHIMPVYDAALDARLAITHVRHEGAAVHMADAWGRLTGEPGIALLTGGPGHANGIGALYTALAGESPMVLLSGHAPLSELGRGSFQEMAQAELAAPVTKASWTTQSVDALGEDIARAMRIARSGRPGPVHVSLPVDLLDAKAAGTSELPQAAFHAAVQPLADAAVKATLAEIGRAGRPLILMGPVAAGAGALRKRLADATGAPVICMESPRGVNDPCLGAYADVLKEADLIVLLGKQPDFTLRFGAAPSVAAACRFLVIDPDAAALARAQKTLGANRVALAASADSLPAAEAIAAAGTARSASTWVGEVESAVNYRPAEWDRIASRDGALHPVEVGRAVSKLIARSPETVLVIDGGEFGQWAQACVAAPTRIINGVAGSIGSAVPFALAAKTARPGAPVVAMLGDGTFGFHLPEFDTAARERLPFVAVVGNDACWNAEHQIQLRAYGRERAHGCELTPARYDLAVAALGGHGECVTRASDLPAALERAAASGKPACVNVMIERLAAPQVSRATAAKAGAAH